MSLLHDLITQMLNGGGGGGAQNAVLYTAQALSEAQKGQARRNIGAVSEVQPEVYDAVSLLPVDGGNGVYLMMTGYEGGVPIVEILGTANDELVNIRGIANPYSATDAANKQYVDGIRVSVSGTDPTITPAANTVYNCGELTALTISNPPATGRYCIKFVSGATPTATVIPPKPAMKWQTDDNEPPQGFPAANTRYEINVDDTYVVLAEWPVPEVTP